MEKSETVDYHIKATWHSIFKMYNQIALKYDTSQATGFVLLSIAKEGTPSTTIAPLLGMEATSLSRILSLYAPCRFSCHSSNSKLSTIMLT